MNEFEQESHERTSQNRARRLFGLIKLFFFFLNERSFRLIQPLFIVWNRLKPFEQFETVVWMLNRLVTNKVHYMEKILECSHRKP